MRLTAVDRLTDGWWTGGMTTPNDQSNDQPHHHPTTLVLGGTGKTGRRVAAGLQARGLPVRAAARSGPHPFDWADRNTWEPALEGVRAAYLVDSQGPDAADTLRDFARLAADRGVGRLVLLSAREADPAARPATEDAVRESGAAWTILRPTWFGQNFSESFYLSDFVREGELRLPTAGGPEPFIDAQDIADVAVAALTEDGHQGRGYDLSGPRVLSFETAVAEIARATGRELTVVPVSGPEYVAHLTGRGYPVELAELLNELLGSVAQGGHDYLSDGVRQVLGREPRDFGDYVKSAAAAGAWAPAGG